MCLTASNENIWNMPKDYLTNNEDAKHEPSKEAL